MVSMARFKGVKVLYTFKYILQCTVKLDEKKLILFFNQNIKGSFWEIFWEI